MIDWELCKNLNLTIRTNGISTTQHLPGEWDAQTSLGFWDKNASPNICQTSRPFDNQQKNLNKRTCVIFDFAIPRPQSKTERKRKEG